MQRGRKVIVPGGFNRTFGPATNSNNLPEFADFVVPEVYKTDDLTNLEFGWKTTLANGNILFNVLCTI